MLYGVAVKVIRFNELRGTEREVHCPHGGFISYRYILERDGMGYSLHYTIIPKGEPQHWHYKNHLESCLCISGKGLLVQLGTGARYEIMPGTCYALDQHDDHTFQAIEDTILVCVFNPPVVGREIHREDGSYANTVN